MKSPKAMTPPRALQIIEDDVDKSNEIIQQDYPVEIYYLERTDTHNITKVMAQIVPTIFCFFSLSLI
ncbi:MAG: hypothetical protein ACFE8P_14230 [Promethearchaeota archaeon]